ncbi:hypothetical protein HaLaN_10846 [Haematococcus lacustris]|uniref:Uncharacterized protein n=1 Tax=Haematococcus lacustris TaxID=44745 RepID=A0A699Z617_HAELA|nr:hypothetical protein HaLaN_10846 [Haematococcus lacustris]
MAPVELGGALVLLGATRMWLQTVAVRDGVYDKALTLPPQTFVAMLGLLHGEVLLAKLLMEQHAGLMLCPAVPLGCYWGRVSPVRMGQAEFTVSSTSGARPRLPMWGEMGSRHLPDAARVQAASPFSSPRKHSSPLPLTHYTQGPMSIGWHQPWCHARAAGQQTEPALAPYIVPMLVLITSELHHTSDIGSATWQGHGLLPGWCQALLT